MRVAERTDETVNRSGSPEDRAAAGARPLLQPSAAWSRKLTPFATEIVPQWRPLCPGTICPAYPLRGGLVIRCGDFAPRRRGSMRGTMMDFSLTLPTILDRSGKIFPRVEIVSRKPDKSIARTCDGAFYRRARRLAAALTKLGLQPGDRVPPFMWNHSGPSEPFFGVPCARALFPPFHLP